VGESTLTDSPVYKLNADAEPDAYFFVESDLSFNDSGSFVITGNYADAIRCNKDLKFVKGTVTVPSTVLRGIKARNSICVNESSVLNVNATDSAIKVTQDNHPEKGYIVIDGGNTNITTKKDAIHAETHLTVKGGYIDIKECDEGIEGQMVDILGGEIHISASNDGINASSIKKVKDTSNIKEGSPLPEIDKDGNVIFQPPPGPEDGEVKLPPPSEGIDGSVYINIVGGKTFINTIGIDFDGIDSNGILYIGGEAEVYSSVFGGEPSSPLDADGEVSLAPGATIVATAASAMNKMLC